MLVCIPQSIHAMWPPLLTCTEQQRACCSLVLLQRSAVQASQNQCTHMYPLQVSSCLCLCRRGHVCVADGDVLSYYLNCNQSLIQGKYLFPLQAPLGHLQPLKWPCVCCTRWRACSLQWIWPQGRPCSPCRRPTGPLPRQRCCPTSSRQASFVGMDTMCLPDCTVRACRSACVCFRTALQEHQLQGWLLYLLPRW